MGCGLLAEDSRRGKEGCPRGIRWERRGNPVWKAQERMSASWLERREGRWMESGARGKRI